MTMYLVLTTVGVGILLIATPAVPFQSVTIFGLYASIGQVVISFLFVYGSSLLGRARRATIMDQPDVNGTAPESSGSSILSAAAHVRCVGRLIRRSRAVKMPTSIPEYSSQVRVRDAPGVEDCEALQHQCYLLPGGDRDMGHWPRYGASDSHVERRRHCQALRFCLPGRAAAQPCTRACIRSTRHARPCLTHAALVYRLRSSSWGCSTCNGRKRRPGCGPCSRRSST
jgi:hypothetical protein